MSRYIDADLAINDLCGSQCGCTINECGWEEPCEKARQILKQPTADVQEIKHGRWEHSKSEGLPTNRFVCSECAGLVQVSTYRNHCMLNYCPNCGAKMDRGENSDK